jgi:CubicO group peptidase (beta-lactamase class C family)
VRSTSIRVTTTAGLAFVLAVLMCSRLPAFPAARFLSRDALTPIADVVQAEIASGRIPGAVVLIGQPDRIIYREAFGVRATRPAPIAATADTMFDLASMTKVIATTTAVMQLVDEGALRLDDPVARYWPDFGAAGKDRITIRHLLTHYSGLRAEMYMGRPWSGYETALRLLIADRLLYEPGTQYRYSDQNFIALGEIVNRVSGTTLDRYAAERIFAPLRMTDTLFRPLPSQAGRIAPTSRSPVTGGAPAVHDPAARRMGGVAGHAGLFSTADDLATFATMLLNNGVAQGSRILSAGAVELMTRPASPAGGSRVRGLGWDLGEPFVSDQGRGAPVFRYGHTGFTGTMLWLDPSSGTYVIVLSNRTHAGRRGDAQPLRNGILHAVSAAFSGPPVPAALPWRPIRAPVQP